MSDAMNISDLSARSQRDRVEFLKTDLALCFTFADLAATELRAPSEKGGATQALEKAEQGYATVERLLSHIDDEQQHRALQENLVQLRSRLDAIQRQIDLVSSQDQPDSEAT